MLLHLCFLRQVAAAVAVAGVAGVAEEEGLAAVEGLGAGSAAAGEPCHEDVGGDQHSHFLVQQEDSGHVDPAGRSGEEEDRRGEEEVVVHASCPLDSLKDR